jgi:hypothetical protein
MFVEVTAGGSLGFVEPDQDIDLVAAAADGVIYRYEERSDRFAG